MADLHFLELFDQLLLAQAPEFQIYHETEKKKINENIVSNSDSQTFIYTYQYNQETTIKITTDIQGFYNVKADYIFLKRS